MSAVRIYNGVSLQQTWSCIGYKFVQAPAYGRRIEQLPRLASTGLRNKRARIGRNVVTFSAEATRDERPSIFYSDAKRLDDVLAIWSLVSGLTVTKAHHERWPTSDDLWFKLADAADVTRCVSESSRKITQRPPRQNVRAAVLVYLEIPHVRTVEVKSALLTTVLECFAPISAPANAPDRQRYRPIIEKLLSLASKPDNATPQNIEQLVVALYKIRNGFAHAGGTGATLSATTFPIGAVTAEARRVVNASRFFCKLAIGEALSVPLNTSPARSCTRALHNFFQNGTFSPQQI